MPKWSKLTNTKAPDLADRSPFPVEKARGPITRRTIAARHPWMFCHGSQQLSYALGLPRFLAGMVKIPDFDHSCKQGTARSKPKAEDNCSTLATKNACRSAIAPLVIGPRAFSAGNGHRPLCDPRAAVRRHSRGDQEGTQEAGSQVPPPPEAARSPTNRATCLTSLRVDSGTAASQLVAL